MHGFLTAGMKKQEISFSHARLLFCLHVDSEILIFTCPIFQCVHVKTRNFHSTCPVVFHTTRKFEKASGCESSIFFSDTQI